MTNLLPQLQNSLCVWNALHTLFVHSSVSMPQTIPTQHWFIWCNNTEFSEKVHFEMVSTYSPSWWWLAKLFISNIACGYSTSLWDLLAPTIMNKAKTVWCDTISSLLAGFQDTRKNHTLVVATPIWDWAWLPSSEFSTNITRVPKQAANGFRKAVKTKI